MSFIEISTDLHYVRSPHVRTLFKTSTSRTLARHVLLKGTDLLHVTVSPIANRGHENQSMKMGSCVLHGVVFHIYSSPVSRPQSTGTPEFACSFFLHIRSTRLIMVSSFVFQEAELLSSKICTESDGRDAEAGKRALEAVEAAEGACVSPLLTAWSEYTIYSTTMMRESVLSCPWIALGAVRGGCSELLGVKAGDGGAWCHCDGAGGVS
jgi:hypothetical protein